MTKSCPSAAVLQRIAQGEPAPTEFRDHLGSCAACLERIEEIRENERFLAAAGEGLLRAMRASPPPKAIPESGTVPGYELIAEISRGGQGVVYRAMQTSTKRPAAVKMLLSGAFATERQRARFEREIEIAANLRHPSIVTVFGSGDTRDGRRFVAMEFVEGTPLDEYLRDRLGPPAHGGRERIDAVMRLMQSIASGVGLAHASGVIHRDLKPSNILVDERGIPRILDFGLARAAEAASGVNVTIEFVGTPAFAAPEQFAGGPASVGAASDVYSLGLIAYHALTESMPYSVDGALARVAAAVSTAAPAPLSAHVPRIPADVETIVMKCLAKDPARRYSSGDALETDIRDYLAGRPIAARRDSTLYMLSMLVKRHTVPAVAALLVLLTIIGATVGLALLARDLDAARRGAEAALAASTVQRARLLAASNIEEAESLLWGEARRVDADERGLLAAPHEARRAAWALVELYARLPRVVRHSLDAPSIRVGFEDDGRIGVVQENAVRRSWNALGEPSPSPSGDAASERAPLKGTVKCSRNARFAVHCDGDSVSLRECASGRIVGECREWPRDQEIKSLSNDGTLIASTNPQGVVRLTNARTFETIGDFEDGATDTFFDERSGHTALLISRLCEGRPCVVILEPPDWRMTRTAVWTLGDPIQVAPRDPRFTAEGTMLLAGFNENMAAFDLSTEPPAIVRLTRLRSPVNSIFPDDSRGRVLVGSMDGTMTLLRLDDFSTLMSIPNGRPGQVALAPDGATMAAADDRARLSIYETTPRAWQTKIESSPVTHAAIDDAPDGTLAWGDDDGMLHIRSPSPPHEIINVHAHDSVVTSVSWSPDGARLLTAGFDGGIREWNRRGEAVRLAAQVPERVWSARYSPDGKTIAAGDRAGDIHLWAAVGNDPPQRMSTPSDRVAQVAFNPDGRLLASACIDHGCVVWNLPSGEERYRLTRHGMFTRTADFSPDGRVLATGGDDRAVCLWDAATGELIRAIEGLPWGPFQLKFHPSGRIIVAVGRGPEVIVLDPEAGVELASFPIHERQVFSIAFSADGRSIFTSGQDSWIGVMDLDHLGSYLRGNKGYWLGRAESRPGAIPGRPSAQP